VAARGRGVQIAQQHGRPQGVVGDPHRAAAEVDGQALHGQDDGLAAFVGGAGEDHLVTGAAAIEVLAQIGAGLERQGNIGANGVRTQDGHRGDNHGRQIDSGH
jgi:hypothetical protein